MIKKLLSTIGIIIFSGVGLVLSWLAMLVLDIGFTVMQFDQLTRNINMGIIILTSILLIASIYRSDMRLYAKTFFFSLLIGFFLVSAYSILHPL